MHEAYQLLQEDYICLDKKYPEKPRIYQLPLNTFIGEKMDWGYDDLIYFDDLEKREIVIEDLIGRGREWDTN